MANYQLDKTGAFVQGIISQFAASKGTNAIPIYVNGGSTSTPGTMTQITAANMFSAFSVANGTTTGPVLSITIAGQNRTVTIPSASTTVSGVVTTGTQTFEGTKTFLQNINIQKNVTDNFGHGIRYFGPDSSAAGSWMIIASSSVHSSTLSIGGGDTTKYTGHLLIYNSSGYYATLKTTNLTANSAFEFANYSSGGTLTHVAGTSAVGTSSIPVYCAANGRITQVTASSMFSALSWTAGTTSGPTLSITIAGQNRTAVIPSASSSASGVVTTGTQIFKGSKTFTKNSKEFPSDRTEADFYQNDPTYWPLFYDNTNGGFCLGSLDFNATDATNDHVHCISNPSVNLFRLNWFMHSLQLPHQLQFYGSIKLTPSTGGGVVTKGVTMCHIYDALQCGYGIFDKSFILRNDTNAVYFLISDSLYGTWNSYRPFYFTLSNGVCYVNTSSDLRMKQSESIHKTSEEEAFIILNNLNIINYSYKEDENNLIFNGIIAQELRDILKNNNIGYRPYLIMGYNGPQATEEEINQEWDEETEQRLIEEAGIKLEKENLNDTISSERYQELINNEVKNMKRNILNSKRMQSYDLNEDEEKISYGIDYTKMVPLLIKGWQMHQQQIEQLQQENAELRALLNE